VTHDGKGDAKLRATRKDALWGGALNLLCLVFIIPWYWVFVPLGHMAIVAGGFMTGACALACGVNLLRARHAHAALKELEYEREVDGAEPDGGGETP